MVRLVTRLTSWYTVEMPALCASRGAVELPLLARDDDRAGVDLVDAGEGLDQRRLPGAVLAHQRVDLAVEEAEVHAVQCFDARERRWRCRASPRWAVVHSWHSHPVLRPRRAIGRWRWTVRGRLRAATPHRMVLLAASGRGGVISSTCGRRARPAPASAESKASLGTMMYDSTRLAVEGFVHDVERSVAEERVVLVHEAELAGGERLAWRRSCRRSWRS